MTKKNLLPVVERFDAILEDLARHYKRGIYATITVSLEPDGDKQKVFYRIERKELDSFPVINIGGD